MMDILEICLVMGRFWAVQGSVVCGRLSHIAFEAWQMMVRNA